MIGSATLSELHYGSESQREKDCLSVAFLYASETDCSTLKSDYVRTKSTAETCLGRLKSIATAWAACLVLFILECLHCYIIMHPLICRVPCVAPQAAALQSEATPPPPTTPLNPCWGCVESYRWSQSARAPGTGAAPPVGRVARSTTATEPPEALEDG